MSDKISDRRALAFAIVLLLKKDPEAFATLSEALNEGLQEALEESRRQQNIYYQGMISMLSVSDGRKLPSELKALFYGRIVEACSSAGSCALERDAVEKYSRLKEGVDE